MYLQMIPSMTSSGPAPMDINLASLWEEHVQALDVKSYIRKYNTVLFHYVPNKVLHLPSTKKIVMNTVGRSFDSYFLFWLSV